jgi:hypothetical protein
MRKHWPLLLILLAYLAVAGQYALLTPPWQAPDEPAHYNVIRQLAAGEIPVMAPATTTRRTSTKSAAPNSPRNTALTQIEYEDWQPPLYYLLLTPVFWIFGGSLVALRFTSMLFRGRGGAAGGADRGAVISDTAVARLEHGRRRRFHPPARRHPRLRQQRQPRRAAHRRDPLQPRPSAGRMDPCPPDAAWDC